MGFAKWIGGGLGWALGGPIGALIGYAFGNALENMQEHQGRETVTRPGDFAASLLVLSAAVVRADGKIKREELDFVKKFYERQFGAAHAAHYTNALDHILRQDFSTRDVCEQVRVFMDYSSRVQLLHYLFGIAKADEHVHVDEVRVIFNMAMDMGISSGDFESVKAMFYADNTSAYRVLEITQDATDEEIKKAYRQMAVKFHPDKVAHLGEEFQKAAHEKFRKVNDAYESLKKERNFR